MSNCPCRLAESAGRLQVRHPPGASTRARRPYWRVATAHARRPIKPGSAPAADACPARSRRSSPPAGWWSGVGEPDARVAAMDPAVRP